jgi:hypothetical protein
MTKHGIRKIHCDEFCSRELIGFKACGVYEIRHRIVTYVDPCLFSIYRTFHLPIARSSYGIDVIHVDRTFEGIRNFLEKHCYEGIVFWKDGEPKCKIKRTDFGFPWPPIREVKADESSEYAERI